MMRLPERVEMVMPDVARNIGECEMLLPVVFLFHLDENGEEGVEIIGAPFTSDEDKEILSQMIPIRAKEINAFATLFVAESYSIPLPEGKSPPKGHLTRTTPGVSDCVMFVYQDIEATYMYQWEILPGRKMGKVVDMGEAVFTTGRFANLLGRERKESGK